MRGKTFATALIVLLLTAVLTTPLLAAPALNDDEIELEGTIEEIDLDEGYIVVGGTTIYIDDSTVVLTGRGRGTPTTLDDLEIGQWVSVSGSEQADGSVLATRVKARPMPGEPEENGLHPVAEWLAELYGLDYDEIIAMHESGIGFGLIRKSYRLATDQSEAGLTGEELLEMRLDGKGWGQIRKETEIRPGQGRPPWAGKGENEEVENEIDDGQSNPSNVHPGHGNGNDRSNGNGHGRGNANGRSKK